MAVHLQKEKESLLQGHQNGNYIPADEIQQICVPRYNSGRPCDVLQFHEKNPWAQCQQAEPMLKKKPWLFVWL